MKNVKEIIIKEDKKKRGYFIYPIREDGKVAPFFLDKDWNGAIGELYGKNEKK